MAITRDQLISLGFKKIKRNQFRGTHDTLLLPINKSDYFFSGYDKITKKTNFKIIWVSKLVDGERITTPLDQMGNISYSRLKELLERMSILEHDNS